MKNEENNAEMWYHIRNGRRILACKLGRMMIQVRKEGQYAGKD